MSDKKAVPFEEVLAECEKDPEYRREYLRTVKDEIHKLITENNALRKQLEESNAKLEYVLASIYAKDCNLLESVSAYYAVAQICDEELDKSGALLGRIRDKAYMLALERDDKK